MPKLVPYFSANNNMVSNMANVRGLPVGYMVGAGYYDIMSARASDVFFSFNIHSTGPGHIGLFMLPTLSSAACGIYGQTCAQFGANYQVLADTAYYTNLQELAMIPCSSSGTFEFWAGSITNLYGNLPPKFCLAVANFTAAAFDASASHEMWSAYSYYEYV